MKAYYLSGLKEMAKMSLLDYLSNGEILVISRNFFESNKSDLQNGFFGNISIEEAVFSTIEEADELESNEDYGYIDIQIP